MTADVMQDGREACFAAGMDDFVSKPIRVHEVVAALERCAIVRHDTPKSEKIAIPSYSAPPVIVVEPVVDGDVFESLRLVCDMSGPGTLAALVTDFLSDSQRIIEEMERAVDEREWQTLERLAHTLKGTSGMFGAKSLSRRFAVIEKIARERGSADWSLLFGDIARERARAHEELVARCAT